MCSAQVVTLHLAFSLLMFHPSAPLLSDNLFDTARQSLTFTELLLGLSRPKSAGPVHFRNSEDDFGYMAYLPHSMGHEPNQPDKMVPADGDPTPINDPDHDSICDFSKKESRPDLAVQVSLSQQALSDPRVRHCRQANAMVRRAKQHHDLSWRFLPIPLENLRLVMHSDAAFQNAQGEHHKLTTSFR